MCLLSTQKPVVERGKLEERKSGLFKDQAWEGSGAITSVLGTSHTQKGFYRGIEGCAVGQWAERSYAEQGPHHLGHVSPRPLLFSPLD